MDRGSRMLTLFQTLDKLEGQRNGGSQYSADDIQQIRYCTSKIQQFVSAQEKVYRDIVLKSHSCIDQLLAVLNYAGDLTAELNVVNIFLELVGRSSTSRRCSALVGHGITHSLFHVLVYQSRTGGSTEELIMNIHQLLAKVGAKDRKFGVKARLSQGLAVTLGLLRTYTTQPRLLSPIVQVLKLYSANAVNATYLGKNGAVTCLFRLLSICARKNLSLLKLCLDTLGLLVKSKSNSARAIGHGGVPVLLTMFYDWHKVDTKNRHASLRKAILHVLRSLTNLKSGRRAMMEADGMRLLYASCQQTLECREMDSVIAVASSVMRKCFPRNRLPLATLRSSLHFPLPHSDFHVIDHAEGKATADVHLTGLLHQVRLQRDETGYESSIDNDDDVSSDGDSAAAADRKVDSEDDADELTKEAPYKRSWEDLSQYRTFFPELYEFDEPLSAGVREPRGGTAVAYRPTPTGTPGAALRCGLSSSSSLPSSLSSLLPSSSSSSSPVMRSLLPSVAAAAASPRHSSASRVGLTRTLSNPRLRGLHVDAVSWGSVGGAPCAVNVKTGASVFTLDVAAAAVSPAPSARASKTATPRPTPLRISLDKIPRDWCLAGEALGPLVTATSTSSSSLPSSPTDSGRTTAAGVAPDVYAELSRHTVGVGRFNKVAYPEMHGCLPLTRSREPFYEKSVGMQRVKVFEDIDRFIHPEEILDRVVYDLDEIIATSARVDSPARSSSVHSNCDESRLSKKEELGDQLKFNSQFESGNLRKAIQVRKCEYDLLVSPDVNVSHHHQWFYFEVSNMEAGVKYRFNIVNCEKLNSQFNFGMKPVLFSVAEAMQGRSQWVRAGSEICYYRNNYVRSSLVTGGAKGKAYYTTTFSMTFKHRNDVCYLAYHYPYTYTMLQANIHRWQRTYDLARIYFRRHALCKTLSGNDVPLLTITAQPDDAAAEQQLKTRPYIFLTSRVHPGESNSSWVMSGTIDFLLSDKPAANALRQMYIFKIVPMLNPDGVINGNHRCSLVGEDLNRRWLHPCPKLHPPIYHSKGLLQYLYVVNHTPMVFCDYHGHSRRKNVFLYGCSASQSWMNESPRDTPTQKDSSCKMLARTLSQHAPAFSLSSCSFTVEQAKETTARVVVWRQLGVTCSYTMESSYCGCDRGVYKGLLLGTWELQEMGTKFCEALLRLRLKATASLDLSQASTTESGADHSMDETLSMSMHGGSSSSGDSSSGTASEIEALFEDDTSDTGYD